MSRYYHQFKDCEFCNEEFEYSREDARFCSPKCRTAHHRREQRRQEAERGMATAWDAYTRNAYISIIEDHAVTADAVKDLYINHSAEAAADAVKLAYSLMHTILNRAEYQIEQKQKVIENLRKEQDLLHRIKRLVTDGL